jgi:hypothetical protein
MWKRLKKLARSESDQAQTFHPNTDANGSATRPPGDSSFLRAFSRTKPLEQGGVSQESTDESEPDAEETEPYGLDCEPHGLFVLYPEPGLADPQAALDVE